MSHTTLRTQQTHSRFLTVREFARAVDVSEETIRRRCDDGTIRAIRLGSVRRIFASELDRLLDHKEKTQ